MATATKKGGKGRKKQATETVHVGFLIDESGSMGSLTGSVVAGFNEFVAELKTAETDKETRCSLAFFDQHANEPICRIVFSGVPLDEVRELSEGDYRPRGMTPLRDALVTTIGEMQKGMSKGDGAILVAMTDGYENASETPAKVVSDLTAECETEGWAFIYLGANQDAWAGAQAAGMPARVGTNSAFTSSSSGTKGATRRAAVASLDYLASEAPVAGGLRAQSVYASNAAAGDVPEVSDEEAEAQRKLHEEAQAEVERERKQREGRRSEDVSSAASKAKGLL